MSEQEQKKGSLVALRERREQVIELLSDSFANDVLDMDQFEERVGTAHRASSIAELDSLVEDLAPLGEETDDSHPPASEVASPVESSQALVSAPAPDQALALTRAKRKRLVAVFGGVDRKGSWRVPEKLRVVAVMGGASLDFREAALPPGVTDVQVTAVMGGVDILVPPTLAVEAEGSAIFGGFEGVDRAPPSPDPDAPLLRIHGLAFMGGVDIQTRLPGEGGLAAWRRRRHEKKALHRRAARELAAAQDRQLVAREKRQLPDGTPPDSKRKSE